MTVARPSSNTIVKFADDTVVVVGLISCNNEKAYQEEVANLSLWCQDNSLMLNVSKAKELIVDFRRTQQHQRTYTRRDLWDSCGEGEQLQVPGSPHCRGSDLHYAR